MHSSSYRTARINRRWCGEADTLEDILHTIMTFRDLGIGDLGIQGFRDIGIPEFRD